MYTTETGRRADIQALGITLSKQLQNIFGIRHLKFKLAAITAALLIVMGSLMEDDFRVSADAVLEGKIQRVVAAPFSGYLHSASVRAGDIVHQGDIMASLNDSEIKLQLAQLEGELQKVQLKGQPRFVSTGMVL